MVSLIFLLESDSSPYLYRSNVFATDVTLGSGLSALMTDLRLLNKESLWISRQQLIFALIARFAKAEALISIRCKSLADARSLFLSCLSHSSLALAPNFS